VDAILIEHQTQKISQGEKLASELGSVIRQPFVILIQDG
jgi:hypothetical protein